MKDLITIGIPVYNVEKYVEKALISALNQTYSNIEYILVDDKGADRSMPVVHHILSNHPRRKDVRVIEHQKNIGTGAVKNTIIDAANGEYLFFMDSDDEIPPDCIEKLYMKMQDNQVDFVVGSYISLLRTGDVLANYINDDTCICGNLEIAWQFFEKRNKSFSVPTWNKLFQTSFLRDNQIYCLSDHLNEDNLFSFQLFLRAFSCSFIPDITYFHYNTPNSVINQSKRKNTSFRIGRQYTEITAFEWKYVEKYRHERIYESLLTYIINNIFFFSDKISMSTVISSEEKRDLLKNIQVFPIPVREILRLKRKRPFLLTAAFIFRMPFHVLIFKFIRALSKVKKKIVG